jgi:hypothetical protein
MFFVASDQHTAVVCVLDAIRVLIGQRQRRKRKRRHDKTGC